MPLFSYIDKYKSSEPKSTEEWKRLEMEWNEKHPVLVFINKIYDFFYYPISGFISWVFMIPREIKWFFQRGIRGWADCDTWGFNGYNSRVVKEAIKHLKNTKTGHPCSLYTYTEQRNPTTEETQEAIAKWEEILNSIIYSFECLEYISNQDWYEWYPGCENFYPRLQEKNPILYDDIHFQTEEEYKKMKVGMNNFCEYYMSLWD